MSEQFELNGHTYIVERMPVRKQFHLARKLLAILGPMARNLINSDGRDEDVIMPLATAIAGMADADADQIINTCLGVIKRQTPDGWLPVLVNNEVRFEDIDLPIMVQLVARVIQERLGSFSTLLPAEPPKAMEKAST